MTDELIPADFQPGHGTRVSALTVAPSIADISGAIWAWNQTEGKYEPLVDPWANEDHLPSYVHEDIQLGSLESLAQYIERFAAVDAPPLLTWNRSHIHAQLDYHTAAEVGPMRWSASYAFKRTQKWANWNNFCNGLGHDHQTTIEFIENHFEDLDAATSGDLADAIRAMKGVLNKTVESTINLDGTTRLAQTDDRSVNVTVPTEFKIAIPVIEGHTASYWPDPALPAYEVPVLQELTVRLRVAVSGNDAKVSFRLVIPTAERVLDEIIAKRVADFGTLVTWPVLRIAD